MVLSDAGAECTHAVIHYQDGAFTLTDLDSDGGTWIRGERVARTHLLDRSRIRIGNTTIRFVALNEVTIPEDDF